MRAVVQRAKRALVRIDGETVSEIGAGLCVFLGVEKGDDAAALDYLAGKIVNLRIFQDPEGRMNLSLQQTGGAMLVVSQFTLLADCRKGRRPSFIDAEEPDKAQSLYRDFIAKVQEQGIEVGTGVFQAKMEIELVNDGPVTILLDSGKVF